MSRDAQEEATQQLVDHVRAGIEIQQVDDPEVIRAAAIEMFTKQLDGKIKNLQDGEMLQITFRVDIVGRNGRIRGGSGANRNMPEYIDWRAKVYERDGFTCQECGATTDLNAHHIKSWSAHRDLRFDVGNGITLCGDCHAKKHPHLRMMRDGTTD